MACKWRGQKNSGSGGGSYGGMYVCAWVHVFTTVTLTIVPCQNKKSIQFRIVCMIKGYR